MQKKKVKCFLKLKYYRKKYGFSQSDMASFIGVKQSCYSHKINRKTPITYDEMEIIRDMLNKKATKAGDSLLTFDEIFTD